MVIVMLQITRWNICCGLTRIVQ